MFARMLILLSLLCSSLCFASGKLTLKPGYNIDDEKTKYTVGLAVYEKIQGKVFYNGWYGGGMWDYEQDRGWLKTTQGVDYYFGPLCVGAGFSYEMDPQTDYDRKELYSNLSLTIW